MAIHVTAVNGMGASTYSSGTITNTGMKAEDHMQVAQDFVTSDGIAKPDDLVVTQNGTPNMSVNVAAGTGYVLNASYAENSTAQNKLWRFINDATVNATIAAADGSNPRIDLVCAKFNTGATPDDNGTNVVTIVSSGTDSSLKGTPAASPVAPSTPSNYLLLATVTVGTGVTSITNANITDQRYLSTLMPIFGPAGFLINGQITTSVSSNNLTVAIKTAKGATPSSTDPVWVRIGNTMRRITAALSLTINAGTNTFNSGSAELATQDVDYFTYLAWNASNSAVRLGCARIPYGTLYSDFSGTATNELYMATSGTLSATDTVENVGRFNAILSASASFNWSIGTSLIINKPIFKTRQLIWNPTHGGFSVDPTLSQKTYELNDRVVEINYRASGSGTSNATTYTMVAPFTAKTLASGAWGTNWLVGNDNGAAVSPAGNVYIQSASNSLQAFKTVAGGTWTNVNGKAVTYQLRYPIA